MTQQQMPTTNLYSELLQECQAMAEYALASGKKVSDTTLQTVYDCTNEVERQANRPKSSASGPKAQSANNQKADAKQAEKPPHVDQLYGRDLTDLVTAHQQLVGIVTPATPRALILLARQATQDRWTHILGPVPMIRHLIAMAFFFLVVFIITSLSPAVIGQADLSHSNGMNLFLNEIFLLAAAGLGATFAMLFKVNNAIADGTYDPRLDGSYWVKIVSGLVAGLLLATLIPLPDNNKGTITDIFNEPVLALLGGFSSEVFLQLLNRFITSLESLFTGTVQDQTQGIQEMTELNTKAAVAQERLNVATKVIKLQQELANAPDPDQLKKLMSGLTDDPPNTPTPDGQLALEQKPSTPSKTTAAVDSDSQAT